MRPKLAFRQTGLRPSYGWSADLVKRKPHLCRWAQMLNYWQAIYAVIGQRPRREEIRAELVTLSEMSDADIREKVRDLDSNVEALMDQAAVSDHRKTNRAATNIPPSAFDYKTRSPGEIRRLADLAARSVPKRFKPEIRGIDLEFAVAFGRLWEQRGGKKATVQTQGHTPFMSFATEMFELVERDTDLTIILREAIRIIHGTPKRGYKSRNFKPTSKLGSIW
jgi:hypothetical protein